MFHPFFTNSDDPDTWGLGWTPPWMRGEGHSLPHPGLRFMHMRRHGFGGPFGGPRGPFGQGENGRFFGRGDVKFALLALLRERPMYGYEMIKALEEKSGGFYTPSPGSIYPTLQMLEERSLVSVQEIDGKKVYSITDAGRALLQEHQEQEQHAGPPWMRHRRERGGQSWGRPDVQAMQALRAEAQALRSEAMEVARLFAIAGRSAITDSAQLTRLRGIIERSRKELTEMIYGDPSSTNQPPPPAE